MTLRAVVVGDTAAANHHGCQLVMDNLLTGLNQVGVEVVARHSGLNWRDDVQLTKTLRDSDLLVVNGEGTIHHDRSMGRQLVAAGEFAAQHGVPAFLVNCTWHANHPELARRARVFRRIYVRESSSHDELKQAGVDCATVPDLTLATAWAAGEYPRQGWLITDSAQYAVSKRLYQISCAVAGARFAPIVSGNWSRAVTTRRWKRQFQFWIGSAGIGPVTWRALAWADSDVARYLRRMRGTKAVLTGRFHAACFALLTGTPLVAVKSNTTKIEALLRDAGLAPHRMLDLGKLTPSSIKLALEQAALTAEEKAGCVRYVEHARWAIADMFREVAREAGP